MFHWLLNHTPPMWLTITMVVISAVTFATFAVVTPRWLIAISADHFVRQPPPRSMPLRVLRIALGSAFVVVGIALLFLPGPGILCILVGLSVADLPFKRRMSRWLIALPRVKLTIDELRKKAGRPPLILP